MISKIFSLIRKLLSSAERDRIEDKFIRIDNSLDHFDERLDHIERKQAAQDEKLSAIHEVTLANNEALEQKLNASKVSAEVVRQIVDLRVDGVHESIRHLQSLIEKVIRRDCNLN